MNKNTSLDYLFLLGVQNSAKKEVCNFQCRVLKPTNLFFSFGIVQGGTEETTTRALPLLSSVILRLEVELTSRTDAGREERNKTFIRAGVITVILEETCFKTEFCETFGGNKTLTGNMWLIGSILFCQL